MVHFATRMYIHPDRWLPKDYRTAGKSREEKQINDALDELRVLIRRRYDQMLRGEETITAAMLKNAITGLDQSASTLLGVCDRFIEDYTDLLRTKQCCRETYLRYLLTRNRLEDFCATATACRTFRSRRFSPVLPRNSTAGCASPIS